MRPIEDDSSGSTFESVAMEALRSSGWRLSAEGFKPESGANAQREALNADLKDIGEACVADILAETTSSSSSGDAAAKAFKVPQEGLVLQVSRAVDPGPHGPNLGMAQCDLF